MPTLSAILPLYFKNNPAQVKVALDSILAQTRLPDELMVVTDGPVPAELEHHREGLLLGAADAAHHHYRHHGRLLHAHRGGRHCLRLRSGGRVLLL